MISYLLSRLATAVIVVFVASLIAFTIMHLQPGDPVRAALGSEAPQAEVDRVRHEVGLDLAPPQQYLRWLGRAVQGDFGRSISLQQSTGSLIAAALPITLYLGLLALLLSLVLSIPLGTLGAIRRGSALDSAITVLATAGLAMPSFWIGIIGIYFLAFQLRLLPVQGFTSPMVNLPVSLHQAVLPVVLLALGPLASLTRQMRSAMLEVVGLEYIRTARAKGLGELVLLHRHALKNALIPVITLLGLQVRNLIGGSVIVEQLFNIPGMGRLLVRSVTDKDFPVVQANILVVAVVVVLASLIVDIAYGYLDPRIRR